MKKISVPNHLGIILDGNRRWAKAHGLPVWVGHRKGAENFENFLNWCVELGINQVSVYALSTENLNRPKKEVEEIFKIFYEYLKKWEKGESDFLEKYKVKVRFIGDLDRLPPKLVRLMGKIMEKTSKHQKRVINLLVAYGSKFELINMIKRIAEKVLQTGKIEITEKDIESNLLLPSPVDLIIRTGGEYRLSNFLLWQSAYSELIFLKKFWPDFTKQDLIRCIIEYNRRQRRFGK